MFGGRIWGCVFELIRFVVEVSLALYPHYFTIIIYWICILPNQIVTLVDWWNEIGIKLPHLSKLLVYWAFEWSHISLLSLIPLWFFTFGLFGMFFLLALVMDMMKDIQMANVDLWEQFIPKNNTFKFQNLNTFRWDRINKTYHQQQIMVIFGLISCFLFNFSRFFHNFWMNWFAINSIGEWWVGCWYLWEVLKVVILFVLVQY